MVCPEKSVTETSSPFREQFFKQQIGHVILTVHGVCFLGGKFLRTTGVGNRVLIRPERNSYASSGWAVSVYAENEGEVAGGMAAKQAEALAPFILDISA